MDEITGRCKWLRRDWKIDTKISTYCMHEVGLFVYNDIKVSIRVCVCICVCVQYTVCAVFVASVHV